MGRYGEIWGDVKARACVLSTPTSGREDGLVPCLQSTAWRRGDTGTVITAEYGRNTAEYVSSRALVGMHQKYVPLRIQLLGGTSRAAPRAAQRQRGTRWPRRRWRTPRRRVSGRAGRRTLRAPTGNAGAKVEGRGSGDAPGGGQRRHSPRDFLSASRRASQQRAAAEWAGWACRRCTPGSAGERPRRAASRRRAGPPQGSPAPATRTCVSPPGTSQRGSSGRGSPGSGRTRRAPDLA
jgi:hypothetical protein